LIGITTSVVGKAPERVQVNASYLRAVQDAGGVPLLIPPQLDEISQRALAGRIDGLLLTGGGDVDPALYGEEPHPTLAFVSRGRDEGEIGAIYQSLSILTPFLSIFLFIQILNVALGGSLHQDIPSDFATGLVHSAPEGEPGGPLHAAAVAAQSRLGTLLGTSLVDVNSRHHQSVKRLGRGLVATAAAPDGVVEAMELPGETFVVAVQWHPEDMVADSEHARRLFAGFLAEAARHQSQRLA
jgi:putative glutamine amidotransferase